MRVWDAASGRCEATLSGHTDAVLSVSWRGDGARLASGSSDNTVRVWDAASGRCEATLSGHTDAVLSVSWRGDGARLASGSSDKTVRVWDAASGRCEATLSGHTDAVLSVSWSGDGARLASGSSDKTVRVWDAASGAVRGDPVGAHRQGPKCLLERRREVGPLGGYERSGHHVEPGGAATEGGREAIAVHQCQGVARGR